MPAIACPCGSTPSSASSATAPGISPSPHALSIGPARGSRTTTSSPARAACRAVARPTGPPPATTRSRIGDASAAGAAAASRGRRSRRGSGRRAAPALSTVKTSAVIQARVHERQRDALDDDRDVVGVARAAGRGRERPAPARARRSRGCSTAGRGWRCTTSAAPGRRPPARASTRPAAAGTSGRRDPRLDQRADQQPGVQHDHERVVPLPGLDAAALAGSTRRCAWRRPARPAARAPTSADQDGERDQAGHDASARSSTSSEQKPGPIAISMPWLPGARRPLAQGVLEDVQHRGRGQVADRGPASPRSAATAVAGHLERVLAAPRSPWGRRGGRPTSRCRRG